MKFNFVLITILVLFFANNSTYGGKKGRGATPKTYDFSTKTLSELQKELETINRIGFADRNKDFSDISNRLNAISERIKTLPVTETKPEDLTKFQSKLKETVNKIKPVVERASNTSAGGESFSLNNLNEAVNSLEQANNDFGTKLDEMKGKIDEIKNSSDLLMEVKWENLHTAQLVSTLARKLDSTMLGAFMRSKMEGMLRSQEFCDAAKNCSQEGGLKKNEKAQLKGLFDSTSDKGGKSAETHGKAPEETNP